MAPNKATLKNKFASGKCDRHVERPRLAVALFDDLIIGNCRTQQSHPARGAFTKSARGVCIMLLEASQNATPDF